MIPAWKQALFNVTVLLSAGAIEIGVFALIDGKPYGSFLWG